jgi:uncharacterized protein HemX
LQACIAHRDKIIQDLNTRLQAVAEDRETKDLIRSLQEKVHRGVANLATKQAYIKELQDKVEDRIGYSVF